MDVAKPKAVIIDIDGTLALRLDRGPFDWNRVGEDLPNKPIIDLVQILMDAKPDWAYLFVSGRDEVCRNQTIDWLTQHLRGFRRDRCGLFMRPNRDNRPDCVVKGEIYERNIAPRWRVMYVLDDRRQVVDMWRDRGLTVLDVADNEF